MECISTLYPEIYWALFTSQGYQNFDFLGVHRMQRQKIDNKSLSSKKILKILKVLYNSPLLKIETISLTLVPPFINGGTFTFYVVK